MTVPTWKLLVGATFAIVLTAAVTSTLGGSRSLVEVGAIMIGAGIFTLLFLRMVRHGYRVGKRRSEERMEE